MKKVKFKEWTCNVVIGKYPSTGQNSIELRDVEDNTPVAKASINLPDYKGLGPKDVIIKDYAENQGMYYALLGAGIISKAEKSVRVSQFVVAPICKLKITK